MKFPVSILLYTFVFGRTIIPQPPGKQVVKVTGISRIIFRRKREQVVNFDTKQCKNESAAHAAESVVACCGTANKYSCIRL
jgi:translation initiation factor 1 (eIF-1/SUI1)